MALEIERKFLVEPERFIKELLVLAESASRIVQGYANLIPQVRIRHSTKMIYSDFSKWELPFTEASYTGSLTVKFPGPKEAKEGLVRTEYNQEIPEMEAVELLSKIPVDSRIVKFRYILPFGGTRNGEFEVDVFKNQYEGLVVAEFEFDSVDEAEDLDLSTLPSGLDVEITDVTAVHNLSLIQFPEEAHRILAQMGVVLTYSSKFE